MPPSEAYEIVSNTLTDWKAIHSLKIRNEEKSIILKDGDVKDWFLFRAENNSFLGDVKLNLVYKPCLTCNTDLHINHWGGHVAAVISPKGEILYKKNYVSHLNVIMRDDGFFELDACYINNHESVSIGTSLGVDGYYHGLNRDQYILKHASIGCRPVLDDRKIVLVDVGAMGGLQPSWSALRPLLKPVMFEPNPYPAKEVEDSEDQLIAQHPQISRSLILRYALSNKRGTETLFATRHPGCSSLLEPNAKVLARYELAPIFDVVGRCQVETMRYDEIHARNEAPKPDVIKIDVQGFEFQVLEGFGSLLDNCIGIELEAHFYELYKGQKLIGDIVTYLDKSGFSLRALRQQNNFDGDAVEHNCYFTKREKDIALNHLALEKLHLIEEVWQLSVSPDGSRLKREWTNI